MDTSLSPKELDVQRMLACEVHIGTRNVDSQMERYVWRRRADGIHLIHLGKTLEKMKLAARMVVTVENPADVTVVSARPYGRLLPRSEGGRLYPHLRARQTWT